MTIEFRCPSCEKKLKTSDEKAGRTAKCPQCGTSVTVPAASTAEGEFDAFSSFDDAAAPPPRRATAAGQQIACPMCGAMNDPAAGRCYACGEDLYDEPGTVPAAARPGRGQIDIGEALSGGWAVFRDQLGGLLALCVVTGLVSLAAIIPFYVLFIVVFVAAAAGGGQPPVLMLVILQMGFVFLLSVVLWYFNIGFTRALLLLVRNKELNVAAIFSGGRYYGLMALNSLVIFAVTQGPGAVGQVLQQAGQQNQNGALMGIGLLLSLMTAVIGAVIYSGVWPYTYIIVDDRSGTLSGLDPLRRAWKLTSGSRLLSFAMFLLLGIIQIGGVLAFCVGVIFTYAYMMATITVAYEQLSPRLRTTGSRLES